MSREAEIVANRDAETAAAEIVHRRLAALNDAIHEAAKLGLHVELAAAWRACPSSPEGRHLEASARVIREVAG